MTSTAPSTTTARPRLRAVHVAVLVVLAAFLVALSAVLDTATARSHDGLARLRFGWPVPWVQQDQTTLDPSAYPYGARFGNPTEYDTDAALGPFVLDVVLVLVVLLVVGAVVRTLHRRRVAG